MEVDGIEIICLGCDDTLTIHGELAEVFAEASYICPTCSVWVQEVVENYRKRNQA